MTGKRKKEYKYTRKIYENTFIVFSAAMDTVIPSHAS
jgi:hypothetical protein